ncbi:hypothetical protein SARC_06538 [Sphaeroforma arctica JP610]|uniref:Trimeric autotransporter adhesin YadA-like head domain-containing protein n=1 Tax=Sphaeroforma arctica JP610 TaxID=667725 RepID=A0A0L0FYU2_9EUKA|nr:hypothetical protein SARC_06538 [Sphaeroforma arctica JP610]KNC81113.1 hypothetical protein SARC_06538 [Sphaeroforma arctica JP610]|eukprot:XP_014155015.1 hypothetical protein SARC_06538 [Sphaeroforma arctica JP610]
MLQMDLAEGTRQIQLGTLMKADADDDSTELAPISVREHTGHVELQMSDARTVVAGSKTFTGTPGPQGSTGPRGEKGAEGVGVSGVVLDQNADTVTVSYTDGTERATKGIRGPKGLDGLHFELLAVTPRGMFEIHLGVRQPSAGGRTPKQPVKFEVGSVYEYTNSGETSLAKGHTGPRGLGIKGIVYCSETKSLQLTLNTQTVIEIPYFVGVDGKIGSDAIDLDEPVAGPAGPEGPEGPRGTDGGLDMQHTTPYVGDGDYVLWNGNTFANSLVAQLLNTAPQNVPSNGTPSVYMGAYVGNDGTSTGSVGLGESAGAMQQGVHAVAVAAGSLSQGQYAMAIGLDAGGERQGTGAVVVGVAAGATTQGDYAVAMGYKAGNVDQGARAVAVGDMVGMHNQLGGAITLGAGAGYVQQGAKSIVAGAGCLCQPTRSSSGPPPCCPCMQTRRFCRTKCATTSAARACFTTPKRMRSHTRGVRAWTLGWTWRTSSSTVCCVYRSGKGTTRCGSDWAWTSSERWRPSLWWRTESTGIWCVTRLRRVSSSSIAAAAI